MWTERRLWISLFCMLGFLGGFGAGENALATILARAVPGPVTPDQIAWDKVPESSQACLKCHAAKAITGSALRDWQLSKHYTNGVGCADCHLPAPDAAAAITGASSACEDKRVRRGVSPKNCVPCHAEQFQPG
jgi:nitrate reductase cytochrome c-type subunit